MAVYRTSRCPHCSYALESFTPTAKERIGPPVINCPLCNKPIKTEMKYWSQFSSSERAWYFISQGFIILYTVFAYSLGGGVVVSLIPGIPIEVGIGAAVVIGVVVLCLCIKKNREVMALKEGDNPYFGEQPSDNQKATYQNAKEYREKKMEIVIEKGKILLESVGGNKTILDKYIRYAFNEKHKCPECKKSFPNSVDNCKKCGMDLLDPELFLKSIRV